MAGISASYVDTDQFTVSGDQSEDFTLGRRIQANCGVDGTKYGWVLSASVSGDTTVTLTADSDALTANLTEVYYAQTDVDHHPNVVTASSNLTDNALVRGDGGAKGSQTTTVLVSDNGEMTNPSQPFFEAYVTNDQSNVTGDATVYNVTGAIWTETYDANNDFADGTFTAPVSGNYLFNFDYYLFDIGGSHSQMSMRLVTSNKTYYGDQIDPQGIVDGTGAILSNFSKLVYMDANDTAYIAIRLSGSTKTIDLGGSGYSVFSGMLVS